MRLLKAILLRKHRRRQGGSLRRHGRALSSLDDGRANGAVEKQGVCTGKQKGTGTRTRTALAQGEGRPPSPSLGSSAARAPSPSPMCPSRAGEGRRGLRGRAALDSEAPGGSDVDHVEEDDWLEKEQDSGEDEDEDDDEDEGDSDQPGGSDIISVDFEVFAPKEEDFHGIRALLTSYLDDNTEWDQGSLADAVLRAGESVGSVVKAGEEGHVLGFISCLPLLAKAKGWPGAVRRFVQSRCENAAQWEGIWEALQSHRVGLLLFERVVNLPPQLIPPLYSSLFNELKLKELEEPSGHGAFGVDTLVILSRVYKAAGSSRKRRQRHKHEHVGAEGDGTRTELVFLRPEDELLLKMASNWFTFPLHLAALMTQQERGYSMEGLFMLIRLNNDVDPFLKHLSEMCQVNT